MGAESKSNLKSITEDQEVSEANNRPGSIRQSKDTKVGSKITNFSGLGKKPKEKEVKALKCNYVTTGNEKDKKFVAQGAFKDNTRGSRLILNNELGETEAISINGTRKKAVSVENNSIVIDSNTNLLDNERLAANCELNESINVDPSVSLKTYNDSDSGTSPLQVSTV